MNGDYDRFIHTAFTGFAVGDPRDMLPEMGFQSADEGDGRVNAVALSHTLPEGGWTHVFVLNPEQTKMLGGMLTQRLNDAEFDEIVEARAAAAAAVAETTVVLADERDVRSYAGRRGGSNGDLAG